MSNSPYKDAYTVLQKHAETLRTQKEPNIDDLLTVVTESVKAYKVCKARIDAFSEALEQALAAVGNEGAAEVEAAGSSASGTRRLTSCPVRPISPPQVGLLKELPLLADRVDMTIRVARLPPH